MWYWINETRASEIEWMKTFYRFFTIMTLFRMYISRSLSSLSLSLTHLLCQHFSEGRTSLATTQCCCVANVAMKKIHRQQKICIAMKNVVASKKIVAISNFFVTVLNFSHKKILETQNFTHVWFNHSHFSMF